VPEIVGSPVLTGAWAAATTTLVAADVDELEPAELEAVTTTRIVAPTSSELSVYVVGVVELTGTQFAPPELQRAHWYPYVSGVEPVQVPGLAVSVCPCCAVPVIAGGLWFAGATPLTTADCADDALVEPPAFVPVTTTRNVLPTSAEPTV
jgi:hypothetical protein